MARINLKKFIAEHYKGGVSARDVIREAVTNSIHAGASEITVNLVFSDKQADLLDSDERRVLNQITVSDNGEGFTTENLHYFEEVCTGHKDNIGGKGVGRLSFLKFATTVKIRSQVDGELLEFLYTPEFAPEQVKRWPSLGPKQTSVSLSHFKESINTQVTKLVTSICDDVRLMLFLKAQQGQLIQLQFTHNSRQAFPDNIRFSGSDVTALAERQFDFCGERFNYYLFRDEPPKKGIVAMLCADDLCIEEFAISKKFDACRHLIFVTSPYFNHRSNLERQRLEIPKTQNDTDLVSPISRDTLMPWLQRRCVDMISEISGMDLLSYRNSNLRKLRTYYPFVEVDSLNGELSLVDADEIVRAYRAQQARREDAVVETLEAGRTVSFDDVSHLARDDLARFVVHRALVIESLLRMPTSSAEDAVHSAILPKKSNGDGIRENNVWLVDDKFLAYSSIHSDVALARIIEQVNQEVESKENRRPDVAAFFSKDGDSDPNKLVLIEFKRPGADIFEDAKSLVQCRLYAGKLVNKIPTVREVFAFAIVNVDDEFYTELRQTGYKSIFSPTDRVMYSDFLIGGSEDIPLHLYVMPVSALLKDAKARNRVFEEVLRLDVNKRLAVAESDQADFAVDAGETVANLD